MNKAGRAYKKMAWLIIPTLLFLYAFTARGTEYYVDYENGSDANDGISPTTPWKHCPGDQNATGRPATISLSGGDIVNLKGGVHYRGSITVRWSGLPANPITYRTSPNWGVGKALIEGAAPLTEWKKCTSKVECLDNPAWQNMYYRDIVIPAHLTKMPGLSILIHQDDRILVPAQYPTSTEIGYQTITNYYSVPPTAVTPTSLTDSRLVDLGGNILVGKYIYLWVQPNEVAMAKITDFNMDTKTVTWEEPLNVYTDRNSFYAVANVPTVPAFERPGSYYLDEAERRLYVIPYDYDDLRSKGAMSISVMPVGISVSGAYVQLENLIIQKQSGENFGQGNSINIAGGAVGSVVRNCEVRFTKGYSGTYSTNTWADGTIFEQNNFHDIAGNMRGLVFGGNNIVVRNNIFDKQARTVIYASGARNSYIVGNTIKNSRGVHGNSITVYQGSDKVLVAGNKVINSNPATFEQSTYTIWMNNYIEEGVICWGACENTILANNTCLYGGINVYSTDNKRMINNIAYKFAGEYESSNISRFGRDMSTIFRKSARIPREQLADVHKMEVTKDVDTLYIDDGYESIVKPGDILIISGDPARRIVSSVARVIFYGNWRTRITFSPKANLEMGYTVSVWPGDSGELEYDVHLKTGSAAIDAGVDGLELLPLSAFPGYDFSRDIEGVLRPQGRGWDIGAYEYASDRPEPPKGLRIIGN